MVLVSVDAGGNGVMWAVHNSNDNWDHGYSNFNTNGNTPPSIVYFNNQYHCFFRDHGGSGIMHIVSQDGRHWDKSPVFYTGYNTSSGPFAIVKNDSINIYFRDGSGNGTLLIHSTDGSNFSNPFGWYIRLNIDEEPSATILNNEVFCLVAKDHGGNGIMRSVVDVAFRKMPFKDGTVVAIINKASKDRLTESFGNQNNFCGYGGTGPGDDTNWVLTNNNGYCYIVNKHWNGSRLTLGFTDKQIKGYAGSGPGDDTLWELQVNNDGYYAIVNKFWGFRLTEHQGNKTIFGYGGTGPGDDTLWQIQVLSQQ